MTGDLDGWARWTLTADGTGTRARYEQEVEVNKPLLRRLAVPGRPVVPRQPRADDAGRAAAAGAYLRGTFAEP